MKNISFADLIEVQKWAKKRQSVEYKVAGDVGQHDEDREVAAKSAEHLERCLDKIDDAIYTEFAKMFGPWPK